MSIKLPGSNIEIGFPDEEPGPLYKPFAPMLWLTMSAIFLAFAVGAVVGNYFGPQGSPVSKWGYWIGFTIAYFPCSILVYWLICMYAKSILSVPCCRQRCYCKVGEDYTYLENTACGWIGRGFYFKCKCGEEYLRRGRRFLRVLPGDGKAWYKLARYKKMKGWRTWVDDTA